MPPIGAVIWIAGGVGAGGGEGGGVIGVTAGVPPPDAEDARDLAIEMDRRRKMKNKRPIAAAAAMMRGSMWLDSKRNAVEL